MITWMHILWQKLHNSLLLRLGGMIAAITVLALVGMSTSWVVAKTTQGNGEAINIAGSLRMQSWRMTSLYQHLQQDAQASYQEALHQALQRFDHDLVASPILAVLPHDATTPLRQVYARVKTTWQQTIKPTFETINPHDQVDVLAKVSLFVDQINDLVKQIEQATEAKILVLRVILGITIIGTLGIVGLSIYLVNNILVHPLNSLLQLTDSLRQGKLTVRTDLVGEDEIGQLGRAFNRMAEDLAKLYQNLEARVEQKTAELTRSNRSLDLLYRSITRLHGISPNREVFQHLLQDAQAVLGLGQGSICLKNDQDSQGEVVATTVTQRLDSLCANYINCNACHSPHRTLIDTTVNGQQVLKLPLTDAEKRYGMLAIAIPPEATAQLWQIQLLEALSHHIGVTLASEQRIEQHRRVALLEERAVIARELHDSLAQSLAYMKIQVSRLRHALTQPVNQEEIQAALEELRDGLNSSYQQLRELLSTFRLRMDGTNLREALEQTAHEFAERGNLAITLTMDLPNPNLTPNEEIHLLQIVREALSNILKHAQASQAWVILQRQEHAKVELRVEDNGKGIQQSTALHHYGMAIMEERARALQGSIDYKKRDTGGTCVQLIFTPKHINRLPLTTRIPYAA